MSQHNALTRLPYPVVTRLAPSPTGLIHLGNAYSFLLCWLLARINNGKVLLRIDDIDPIRSRAEFVDAIKADLEWLGLDWDAEIYQSKRQDLYESAIDQLAKNDLVYPCFCTRKELRNLASAPHIGDEGAPYPGTCYKLTPEERATRITAGKPYAMRLRCPDSDIEFEDMIYGVQRWKKAEYGGDFALKRSDGVWAYQFASVIDDGELGVNLCLRGRDLLASTPRQIILSTLAGYKIPAYAHIGLLLDHKGDRLAKRHNSLSIRSLREAGTSSADIIGSLAHMAGFNPDLSPAAPADFLKRSTLVLPKKDLALSEDYCERANRVFA